MQNKNINKLVTRLKNMKKNNEKSKIIFFLGAGFSKHAYDVNLWDEIAEKFIKKLDAEEEVKDTFKIQLVLDYAEDKCKYYTKSLENNKKPPMNSNFQKFYKIIKNESYISKIFMTTNHCNSIQKYFSINENNVVNIYDFKNNFERYKNIGNNQEILFNIHGSFSDGTQVVKISEYQKLFLDDYKFFFSKMKEINTNSPKSKNDIVFIFGSSLNEKHLISFLKYLYGNELTLFYVGHEKIGITMSNIMDSQGFNYISTCNSKKDCDMINECNDSFFKTLHKRILNYFDPCSDLYKSFLDIENKKIITEISKIKNYVFDDTYKEIDKLIKKAIDNKEMNFWITTSHHFLNYFMSKKNHDYIGNNVHNLYLYYYEKDYDFWSIFGINDIFKNKFQYLELALTHIFNNNKFKIIKFLCDEFNLKNKENIDLFNDFFKKMKKKINSEQRLTIINFFNFFLLSKDLDSGYSFYYKKITIFITSLDSFNIQFDYKNLIKNFPNNQNYCNEKKIILIMLILKFFDIQNIVEIIEDIIPELKSIIEINFNDNSYLNNKNIKFYIGDINFIKYIFPIYQEIKKIKMSNLNKFTFNKKLDFLPTNFILNYYWYVEKNDKSKIDSFFKNSADKRIFNIFYFYEEWSGVVHDSQHINDHKYHQYRKKWLKKSIYETIEEISAENKLDYFGDEEEIKKVMEDKISNIFEKSNWTKDIEKLTTYLLKLETPWKYEILSFPIKFVISKYKINDYSLWKLDQIFNERFSKDYLNITDNRNLIDIDFIMLDDFYKIENIKSDFLFREIINLLNVNLGSIFFIFKIKYKSKLGEDKYFFEIWQEIFEKSKDKNKLLVRVIEGIFSIDNEYKSKVKNLFEKLFLDSNYNTFKKAAHFYFSRDNINDSEFYKNDNLKFKFDEIDELNDFFKIMNYKSEDCNIINFENNSLILEIKLKYKWLFSCDKYSDSKLLYNLIFTNDDILINSGMIGFIDFELKMIYKKFYETNKFSEIINENDLRYIWKIFISLDEKYLLRDNIEMIKNIFNVLKGIKIEKIDKKDSIPKITEDLFYFIFHNDKEDCEVDLELYKLKFLLLSVREEELNNVIDRKIKEQWEFKINIKEEIKKWNLG